MICVLLPLLHTKQKRGLNVAMFPLVQRKNFMNSKKLSRPCFAILGITRERVNNLNAYKSPFLGGDLSKVVKKVCGFLRKYYVFSGHLSKVGG
jgi:hypothetical protein